MDSKKVFQKTYSTLMRINMLLYLFAIIGIFTIPIKYADGLNLFLKTIVSLFLMIRFNPYSKFQFNKMDKHIVFSAGLFLFSTTTLNQIVKYYTINKVKDTNKLLKKIFNFNDFHVF